MHPFELRSPIVCRTNMLVQLPTTSETYHCVRDFNEIMMPIQRLPYPTFLHLTNILFLVHLHVFFYIIDVTSVVDQLMWGLCAHFMMTPLLKLRG